MTDTEEFIETPKTKGYSSSKIMFWGTSVVVVGVGLAIYAITQQPGGDVSATPDVKMSASPKPDKPRNVSANDDQINNIVSASDTPPVRMNASSPTSQEGASAAVPPITGGSVYKSGSSQPVNQQDTTQDDLKKQLQQIKNQAIIKQEQNKIAAYSSKTLLLSGQKSNASGAQAFTNTTSLTGKTNASAEKQSNAAYEEQNPAKPPTTWFLKAGTIIPCVLISGLNSENSGNIVAMVSETIYDSRYGKQPLIPQGATIVGSYDSNISFGNSRIVPVFKTLTYPDGAVISLKSLPGSDLSGFTGLTDEVDNHILQMLGASGVVAIITAGMQYSQNNTNANVQVGSSGIGYTNPNPTAGQTIAGSLGQQLGQTGLALTNKYLNISPTIKIRQHAQFNIMLVTGMALPPYSGE